jgi:DNA-directed RNA polymerase subunit RPC12/RpoP
MLGRCVECTAFVEISGEELDPRCPCGGRLLAMRGAGDRSAAIADLNRKAVVRRLRSLAGDVESLGGPTGLDPLGNVLRKIAACVLRGDIEGAEAQELGDAVADLDLPVSDFPV